MPKYWQVAAGSEGRDYAKYFLKYGMAFVGGNTQEATMNNVSKGDIIILKNGLYEIKAVGEIVEREGKHKDNGDKAWLQDFDGWWLPAYCYVDWRKPEEPRKTEGLTRATIQEVHQEKHKQIADEIIKLPIIKHDIEPPETHKVEDDKILQFLVNEGLRVSLAEELTNTFARIRLLADYYYKQDWSDIREHETRTFLVIPLLLALGWAEQQIKIEYPNKYGKIDVTCFSRAYRRKDEECILIIETKGFSSGLDYAPEQAHRYAEVFPSCKVVLVSNGYCYKTYVRPESGSFNTYPSAYLNLLKPKDRYPLDPKNVGGALDVLKLLLPTNLR